MNYGQYIVLTLAAVLVFSLRADSTSSNGAKEKAEPSPLLPSEIESCVVIPTTNTDAPLVIHQQDLIGSESFVSKVKSRSQEYVCLYRDGAIVSLMRLNKDVSSPGGIILKGLSSSVDRQSIMVHSPGSAIARGFYVDEPSDKQQDLRVYAFGDFEDDDQWHIQFSVKNVSWMAYHQVKLSDDGEYVDYTCLFHINNQSGLDLNNVQILFLDAEMPNNSETHDSGLSRSTYCYTHDAEESVPSGQERTIVVIESKRIPTTSINGLFIGGEYLSKINEMKRLNIENWITFPNTVEVSLGKALPSGEVYVYKTRGEFVSFPGISKMHSVGVGGDVTIKIPSRANNGADEYTHVDAQLTQISYRTLSQTLSEAEYRLVLKNSKDVPVLIKVTIDASPSTSYSVERSNMNYEKNKKREAYWLVEIPSSGSKELRYKLTIRTQNATTA
jgi:hypothetical protein